MVVFEFPPSNGSSVQRILSVYNGFIQAGWDVDVLTAKEYAYSNVSEIEPGLLPVNEGGQIKRTFALDVMRHLSFKGKHLSSMVRPDRWGLTWTISATMAGKKIISNNVPDLIWSSAPTPSPHVIANELSRKSGAPWIADYRDPMPYLHRPTETSLDLLHRKIDGKVRQNASLCTFATEETMEIYKSEFKDCIINGKYDVMKNGFDSDLMEATKQTLKDEDFSLTPFKENCFSFYYAGVLYDNGRDPVPLFKALSYFKKSNPTFDFELVFQGAGDGAKFKEKLKELDLELEVSFKDGVSFSSALRNMLFADALVLIQGAEFNTQVPGKVYEYLASGKPILLNTPKESATSLASSSYPGVFTGISSENIGNNLNNIFYDFENNINSYNRDVSAHSRKKHVANLLEWANNLT